MKFKLAGSVRRALGTPRGDSFFWVVAIVLCLILVVGCQTEDDQSSDPEPPAESEKQQPSAEVVAGDGSETSSDESSDESGETQAVFIVAEPISPEEGWAASAHADSYVVDTNGRNDRCARCHSAAEWSPGPEDIPESCLTCKFDVDEPTPFTSEEDWGHISCKVCHRMDDDEVEPEYAWLDIAVIDEYIDVDSTTDLCRKCHEMADIPDHKPSINLADEHADLTCTECHDAHAEAVTCANSDCHEDVLVNADAVTGHDEEHASVSCTACHDSAGLEVGPFEDSEMWVTFTSLMLDGEESLVPHSSHALQTQVECGRCHFGANPWGLSEDVATGS